MTGEVPAYPYGTRLRVRDRNGIVAVGSLVLHWFGIAEMLDIADDYTGLVTHCSPDLGHTFEQLDPSDPGWDPRHVGTLTAIWTEEGP